MPPLRERAGDLPLLLRSLTAEHGRSVGGPVWTPDAVQTISRVSWLENLSSLARLVELMVDTHRGPHITSAHLPAWLHGMATRRPLVGLEYMEAHAIAAALRAADGNTSNAADMLGIARSTLYRKIRALGLDLNGYTF